MAVHTAKMLKRLVLLLCLLLTVRSFSAGGTAFSADVTITQDGQSKTGKLYLDEGKMRLEMTNGTTVNILRTDQRVNIGLMVANKSYMSLPIHISDAAEIDVFKGDAQLAAAGSENINGQMCDKFSQTYLGRPAGTLWKAHGTGVPVRYQSTIANTVVDYSNVKLAPQPASLFDPPADFKKFNLPFGR